MSWHYRVRLQVSHIAGEKNIDADGLSRWDQRSSLPDKFAPEMRVRITISDIHKPRCDVRLWQPETHLLWTPPTASLPQSQYRNSHADIAAQTEGSLTKNDIFHSCDARDLPGPVGEKSARLNKPYTSPASNLHAPKMYPHFCLCCPDPVWSTCWRSHVTVLALLGGQVQC